MYPLRKIIKRTTEYEKIGMFEYPRYYEYLECGHRIKEKSDFYGPTNAYRRRCRKCRITTRATDLSKLGPSFEIKYVTMEEIDKAWDEATGG